MGAWSHTGINDCLFGYLRSDIGYSPSNKYNMASDYECHRIRPEKSIFIRKHLAEPLLYFSLAQTEPSKTQI